MEGKWAVMFDCFVMPNPHASMILFVLQSLSMLLNGTPFAFVIDLAALASRREYLKLDKWLTDKIREHGVCLTVNVSSTPVGIYMEVKKFLNDFS